MGIQAPTNPYETGKLPAGFIVGGRYLLVRKIAQGGMGAVYEAREVPTSTGPRLAIKEMSLSILSRLNPDQQQVLIESFHREFELLSRLSHPNLVQAFQFFEEQNRYFFVMEFIEGRTLETVLDTLPMGQFLPIERVMAWARQLCAVLHYLHRQSPPIIYRDLKPSNVMELYPLLTTGDQTESAQRAEPAGFNGIDDVKIKLFDFGIARFYKPGQKSDTVRFGTDGYLAPEIVAYQVQTSEQTDVYALGAVLHQVLTRFDPQMDPWRRPAIRLINPQVPDHVAQAIDHALALNPANRTPSAAELLKELFGQDARLSIDLGAAPENLVQASVPDISPPGRIPAVVEAGQQMPPSEKQIPSPLPISPPPMADSTKKGAVVSGVLNLGGVRKGRTASGSFDVILSASQPAYVQSVNDAVVQGQISSSSPWLRADPEYFSVSSNTDTKVNVHVQMQTKGLPLGRWDALAPGKSTVPLWFVGLQRDGLFRKFLHGWLAFHLNWFVPLPSRYQGMVQVSIPGNPEMHVQVLLDVIPPAWRSFIGWVLVFGMIGFEVSVVFTLLAAAVSLLVTYVF